MLCVETITNLNCRSEIVWKSLMLNDVDNVYMSMLTSAVLVIYFYCLWVLQMCVIPWQWN